MPAFVRLLRLQMYKHCIFNSYFNTSCLLKLSYFPVNNFFTFPPLTAFSKVLGNATYENHCLTPIKKLKNGSPKIVPHARTLTCTPTWHLTQEPKLRDVLFANAQCKCRYALNLKTAKFPRFTWKPNSATILKFIKFAPTLYIFITFNKLKHFNNVLRQDSKFENGMIPSRCIT